MTWSGMCNDRCPTCDHEIEPYVSEDAPLEAKPKPRVTLHRPL